MDILPILPYGGIDPYRSRPSSTSPQRLSVRKYSFLWVTQAFLTSLKVEKNHYSNPAQRLSGEKSVEVQGAPAQRGVIMAPGEALRLLQGLWACREE